MSCSKKVQSVRQSLKVQNLVYPVLDVGSYVVGLPAIPGSMLLTILLHCGLDGVTEALFGQ